MVHYCPACARFSHHGPGSVWWALTCPACGHTARQEPHPPRNPRHPPPATAGPEVELVGVSGTAEVEVIPPADGADELDTETDD